MDIRVGDRIGLKKGHPCGSNDWEVLRVGIDFRLKCMGCGHMILVPRKLVEKNLRRLLREGTEIPREKFTATKKTGMTNNP